VQRRNIRWILILDTALTIPCLALHQNSHQARIVPKLESFRDGFLDRAEIKKGSKLPGDPVAVVPAFNAHGDGEFVFHSFFFIRFGLVVQTDRKCKSPPVELGLSTEHDLNNVAYRPVPRWCFIRS